MFCGRKLFIFEQSYVVGATGRIVCSECLKPAGKLLEGHKIEKATPSANEDIMPPQEIIHELDKTIIGQDRAKRAVAIAFWKQQLRASGDDSVPRSNLLRYGPTGCGKTALARDAAKIIGLPFISVDATSLTKTGYRGKDAQDIIKDLVARFGEHQKLANSVVFLDEIDKLAARGNDARMAYNQGTQHTLLKLVEGLEIDCNGTTISTEGLLFVFAGAFSGLTAPKRATESGAVHRLHEAGEAGRNKGESDHRF